MVRALFASLVAVFVLVAIPVHAQTGGGSLRGYVKDEQGGVLPGVTVTATSPVLMAPVVAVSESDGLYRLTNLPPGTYTITAELTGFATYRQEGILARAGSTFSIDIAMKVGSLSETVTVSGNSPMVEISSPSSTLNVQGELMRAAPVTSQRLFTDVVEMARASSRGTSPATPAEQCTFTAPPSTRTRSSLKARRPRPTTTARPTR